MGNSTSDAKIGIAEITIFVLVITTISIIVYQMYLDLLTLNTEMCEGMIIIPKIDEKENGWNRTSNCKFYMDSTVARVLKESNIQNNTDDNSSLILPCGYNNINNEIQMLPNVYNKNNSTKRVLIIDGADQITAKNYMWKNIYNHQL